MGVVGYVIKLVFIPINNIILSTAWVDYKILFYDFCIVHKIKIKFCFKWYNPPPFAFDLLYNLYKIKIN